MGKRRESQMVNKLAEMEERMKEAELAGLYAQLGCSGEGDCWVDGGQA